jgi:hypothetical protein
MEGMEMKYATIPGIRERIEKMRYAALTIKKYRDEIHSPNPRKEMLLTQIDEYTDAILHILDKLENMP